MLFYIEMKYITQNLVWSAHYHYICYALIPCFLAWLYINPMVAVVTQYIYIIF